MTGSQARWGGPVDVCGRVPSRFAAGLLKGRSCVSRRHRTRILRFGFRSVACSPALYKNKNKKKKILLASLRDTLRSLPPGASCFLLLLVWLYIFLYNYCFSFANHLVLVLVLVCLLYLCTYINKTQTIFCIHFRRHSKGPGVAYFFGYADN